MSVDASDSTTPNRTGATSIADAGLHVDERGAGPVVVLIHGLPSAPSDFEPLVARLARSHRVLVPHLPGYGRPPADPGAHSIDDVTARLERCLLDAHVSSADIVAFSAGAHKAVAIALGGRIRVPRLVLVAPSIGLGRDAMAGVRAMAAATRAGIFDPRPSWLARMTAPGFAERDPAGAARVLAWLDAAPMSVICDELDAAADAADLRPRLGELACRVLVCAGTDDNAVPPIVSQDVARRIPGAVFKAIERAGHAVLLEATDRAVALVDEFLESDDA